MGKGGRGASALARRSVLNGEEGSGQYVCLLVDLEQVGEGVRKKGVSQSVSLSWMSRRGGVEGGLVDRHVGGSVCIQRIGG